MLLLLDNYDSFVQNLARYLRRLGQETVVVRSDRIDVAGVRDLRPQAIVLSPGPCTPNEAGASLEVIRQCAGEIPLLGVCLGHQAIGQAFGGQVVRAARPRHGVASEIHHDGREEYCGVPSPFRAGRYHSLVLEEATLPDCLEVSARTTAGTIMGVRHRSLPVIGMQYHPESILTEHGFALLANFLALAGCAISPTPPQMSDELAAPLPSLFVLPDGPVTF